MSVVVGGLLAVVVGAAWLGCLGFVRLRTPLDRVHCVAFVNTAAGLAVVVAAFVADGVSTRSVKVLVVVAVLLLTGAALSHATGRAVLLREAADDRDEDVAEVRP